MSLPWDRWPAEDQPDEPELPYEPPVAPEITVGAVGGGGGGRGGTLPQRPPQVDVSGAAQELARDILDEAVDYAKQTIGAIRAGQEVDVLHPEITAETSTGRKLIVADARSRSARTFVQGLIFDLFAGLIAAVATLSGADIFDKQVWIAFGVLLLKTFASAGISYVMRLRVTPTIKTPGEKMAVMPIPRPIRNEDAP